MSSSSGDSDDNDEQSSQRNQIREDLSSMTFEEILKLKEELGAKVYKEAILGADSTQKKKRSVKEETLKFKRLNKNRPREVSARRQVPFLGAELREERKTETQLRDPRFDEKSGDFNMKNFKENYKFITKIRGKEIGKLKKRLNKANSEGNIADMKSEMQKLINRNNEDRKWHEKQAALKQEQKDIQQARAEGRQPHFVTNKERRTKELVKQFEHLKETGKLNKHLEKRRKKNAAKDRKKFSFD